MKRETVLDQIENNRAPWDFPVIGGGATGLGVAVDAAARGYRTLLVEQHDFAMPVVSLIKEDELIVGAVIRDLETGSEYQVQGRAVINAAGVFSDGVAAWPKCVCVERGKLVLPVGQMLIFPSSPNPARF